MQNKEIIVKVSRDGTSVVEAVGFQGQGCKTATEAIEIAIAGRNPNDRKTDPKGEMYQPDTTSQFNYGQ